MDCPYSTQLTVSSWGVSWIIIWALRRVVFTHGAENMDIPAQQAVRETIGTFFMPC